MVAPIVAGFQSLIGRLLTNLRTHGEVWFSMFQSLIGRLLTQVIKYVTLRG